MIPTYNDEDIIEEVIEHLLSQDIELVVLDNGSTDNTFQICKKFSDKGLIKLEQFKSDLFDWVLILNKLYDMAIFESPDWVLRSDSDQFLESGINNLTLKDVISQSEVGGYNIIQFDRFDFFMTDKNNKNAKSVKEKMPYYSYQTDYAYRAWKFVPGINVAGHMGHCPIFPSDVVYKFDPKKLVIRHYLFRNKQQSEKKVQDRIRRISSSSYKSYGLINHLRRTIQSDYSSIVDHRILTKYNEDNQWNYEKKFNPITKKLPSREEMFSNDGLMKNKFSLETMIKNLEQKLHKMHTTDNKEITKLKEKVKHQNQIINNIIQSKTWRILRKYDSFKEKLKLGKS